MKVMKVVVGNDVKNIRFVFDWEAGVYEVLIEKEKDICECIFTGDIEYLANCLEKILEEIRRNYFLDCK